MDTSLFLVGQLHRVCSELCDALAIRNASQRKQAVEELKCELQVVQSELVEFHDSLREARNAGASRYA